MTPWTTNMTARVKALAQAASEDEANLNGLEIAAIHLEASAYSIAHGELAQACERLLLACQGMYGGVSEERAEELFRRELDTALDHRPVIYLDTSVISGLIKEDLDADNMRALERILDVFQIGMVDLCTSKVAMEELDRIPATFKAPHRNAFRLLRLTTGNLTHVEADEAHGAAIRQVKCCLSEDDFRHVIEALAGGAEIFLTNDNPLLSQAGLLEQAGIKGMNPAGLEKHLIDKRYLR